MAVNWAVWTADLSVPMRVGHLVVPSAVLMAESLAGLKAARKALRLAVLWVVNWVDVTAS